MTYRDYVKLWASGEDFYATKLCAWLLFDNPASLPPPPVCETRRFSPCSLPSKLWLLLGVLQFFNAETFNAVGPLLKRTWNGLWKTSSSQSVIDFLQSPASYGWIKTHHPPFGPSECENLARRMRDWFLFYDRLSITNRVYWDQVVSRIQMHCAQAKAVKSNEQVERELAHCRKIREHIRRLSRHIRARYALWQDQKQLQYAQKRRTRFVKSLRRRVQHKWAIHAAERRQRHIHRLRQRLQSRYQKQLHDTEVQRTRKEIQRQRWALIKASIELRAARRKIIANMILEYANNLRARRLRNLKCKQRKLKRAKAKAEAEAAERKSLDDTCDTLTVWRATCIMDMRVLVVAQVILGVALPREIRTKNAMLTAMMALPNTYRCQVALREDIAALHEVLRLLDQVANVTQPVGKPLRTALTKLLKTNWKNEELSKTSWAPWILGEGPRVQAACARLLYKLTMFSTPKLNFEMLDSETLRATPPSLLNVAHVKQWLVSTKSPKYVATLKLCMVQEIVEEWGKTRCTTNIEQTLNDLASQIADLGLEGEDFV